MAVLGDLPHELILEIGTSLMLESLLAKTNPRRVRLAAIQARLALSRWSQTCSRFRSIAQPLLFRCYGDMLFRPRTRHRFLQSLLDRPTLASEVRYINPSQVHSGMDTAIGAGNKKLFAKAAHILGNERSKNLLDHLDFPIDGPLDDWLRNIEDILLAIFLAFIPNLRAIKVPIHHYRQDTPVVSQIVTFPDLIPGCKKLKSLSMAPSSHNSDFPLTHRITPLLSIPSLRKVTLTRVFCDSLPLEPHSLHITDLSLEEACLRRAGLRGLLLACHSLEHFHYMWSPYHFESTEATEMSRIHDIVSALEQHQASLSSLSLNLQGQASILMEYLSLTERVHVGEQLSFSEFTALKHLTIDQWSIGSSEAGIERGHATPSAWSTVRLLPPSIESLKLLTVSRGYEAMQQLAIQCREDFPALSFVVAEAGRQSWIAGLDDLVPFFKQSGVTFRTQGTEDLYEDYQQTRIEIDPLFDVLTVANLLE